MRILVKNFQSIENALLEVTGFTVVTGRSNLGKSALVRAIQAAIFGNPGDHYIREGAVQCGVAIADTGLTIKWRKVQQGKKSTERDTSLEINGTKYTRMGREHGVLTEPLGFKKLKIDKDFLTPQFADQHDSIFLLTQSEAAVAEVFKLLGRADVVSEAQRLAKKDLKDAEARKKIREEDQEKADQQVKELQMVGQLRQRYTVLSADITRSQADVTERETLIQNLDLLRELQAKKRNIPSRVDPPSYQGKPIQIRWLQRYLILQPKKVPNSPGLGRDPLLLERTRLTLLTDLLKEEKDLQITLKWTNHELKGLEDQRKDLEKKLGICPACGRSLNVPTS